jgi:serine protease Do
LWHGRALRAELVARDPRRDLAVLAVDATDLPAAVPGDPAALRVGELVVAFGHPLGVSNALALGIVHAPSRAAAPGGRLADDAWVRADVRLAPGNSGGPLADIRGRVVGINTLIYSGLGVAVSVTEVRRFLAEHGGARAA